MTTIIDYLKRERLLRGLASEAGDSWDEELRRAFLLYAGETADKPA